MSWVETPISFVSRWPGAHGPSDSGSAAGCRPNPFGFGGVKNNPLRPPGHYTKSAAQRRTTCNLWYISPRPASTGGGRVLSNYIYFYNVTRAATTYP